VITSDIPTGKGSVEKANYFIITVHLLSSFIITVSARWKDRGMEKSAETSAGGLPERRFGKDQSRRQAGFPQSSRSQLTQMGI